MENLHYLWFLKKTDRSMTPYQQIHMNIQDNIAENTGIYTTFAFIFGILGQVTLPPAQTGLDLAVKLAANLTVIIALLTAALTLIVQARKVYDLFTKDKKAKAESEKEKEDGRE